MLLPSVEFDLNALNKVFKNKILIDTGKYGHDYSDYIHDELKKVVDSMSDHNRFKIKIKGEILPSTYSYWNLQSWLTSASDGRHGQKYTRNFNKEKNEYILSRALDSYVHHMGSKSLGPYLVIKDVSAELLSPEEISKPNADVKLKVWANVIYINHEKSKHNRKQVGSRKVRLILNREQECFYHDRKPFDALNAKEAYETLIDCLNNGFERKDE